MCSSDLGLVPEGPAIVDKIIVGEPASQAGMQLDDEIIRTMNDIPVQSGNAVGLFRGPLILPRTSRSKYRFCAKRRNQMTCWSLQNCCPDARALRWPIELE